MYVCMYVYIYIYIYCMPVTDHERTDRLWEKGPQRADHQLRSVLIISLRNISNWGSQIPQPSLISTSNCPLKLQISQWLGPYFHIEFWQLAVANIATNVFFSFPRGSVFWVVTGLRCFPHLQKAIRKGGWYSWKPSSNSDFSIIVFRTYPLIEIRQAAPCRAIQYLSQQYPSPLLAMGKRLHGCFPSLVQSHGLRRGGKVKY